MVSMHSILCILMIVLSFLNVDSCPSKCACLGNHFMCTEKQLIEVPDFKTIKKKPRTIDLSGNEIQEINKNSFNYSKLQQVQYLYLNDNSILDIEAESFSNLLDLEQIDLMVNLLTDIPPKIFERNKKLKSVNLSFNFFGSKFPNLESQSLEVLDISFSKILFFDIALKRLPNLQKLYLQGNNLAYIDYSVFFGIKHLHRIDLSHNPWRCSCATIELFENLVENGLTKITDPIKCVSSGKDENVNIYTSDGPTNYKNNCIETTQPPRKARILIEYFQKTKRSSLDNEIFDRYRLEEAEENFTSNLAFLLGSMVFFVAFVIGIIVGVLCLQVKNRRNFSALI